jgi:hypothetical protein
MPAERRVGMDHEHYDWLPLSTRGVLRRPEQACVAICVLVTLEHTEWRPPEGSVQAITSVSGLMPRPFPDYTRLSHREYGHRVGIFRLLNVLEKHGLKPTVAMDAFTAEHYPYLVRHCLGRGCEIIGHGISASRMITSQMPEVVSSAAMAWTIAARPSRRAATSASSCGLKVLTEIYG